MKQSFALWSISNIFACDFTSNVMGIKELWTKSFPGAKRKASVKFETAKGKTLAIDISLMLH